ncbi:hypothetical protein TELCIR_09568 [Teladorsagia circumcincta]|uniref:PID domain-containing protein n=1 Tax=Teladorsagia circumcincta TaxID=45464 RepID=A0A2G9UEP1_TELCI|nr:hypothetical protein TELCIR_09568 [Teladorsagia circumcincta]
MMLHSGSLNFRPPVCRSKSAPRLGSIDEEQEEDESDSDSVCYHAAPEMTPSVSESSTNDQSAESSLGNADGYHEDKLLRGLSEESYYSDGELVMLEEDYEDRDEQMTSL